MMSRHISIKGRSVSVIINKGSNVVLFIMHYSTGDIDKLLDFAFSVRDAYRDGDADQIQAFVDKNIKKNPLLSHGSGIGHPVHENGVSKPGKKVSKAVQAASAKYMREQYGIPGLLNCVGCGSSNFLRDFICDDQVCSECGLVCNTKFVNSHNPSYMRWQVRSGVVVKQRIMYNNVYYSNEKLRSRNGDDPSISPVYIAVIKRVGRILCGGNLRLLSKQRIRRLANILYKPYGERWFQTYIKANLLPATAGRTPERVLYWMHRTFSWYYTALRRLRHTTGMKKRFVKYNYVYRQLLRVHDLLYGTAWHDRYSWWFNIPQTLKKIVEYDTEWKCVFDAMKAEHPVLRALPDIPYAPLVTK